MSLYSQMPSFVLGFHGCDLGVADSVIAGREFLRPSSNEYDWLGEGIYFWEHSPTRALEYATHLQRRTRKSGPRISEPAVIGAVIDLGYCLNLLDSKFIQVVQECYRGLVDAAADAGSELPKNKPTARNNGLLLRDLDCAVINYVHQSQSDKGLQPFDTVRSVFIEGEPLYPTGGFFSKTTTSSSAFAMRDASKAISGPSPIRIRPKLSEHIHC